MRRIETQERQLLEELGGQLFGAVFAGPVDACLERSLHAAQARDAGLRIRLRLPAGLASIPWESMFGARYVFSACPWEPRWCATWTCPIR